MAVQLGVEFGDDKHIIVSCVLFTSDDLGKVLGETAINGKDGMGKVSETKNVKVKLTG